MPTTDAVAISKKAVNELLNLMTIEDVKMLT